MTRTPWLGGLLAALLLSGGPAVAPSRAALGGNPQQKEQQLPMLNKSEREALVGAAHQAWQKYAKRDANKAKGNDLPKEFWGEAVERLKPLRVYNDRANIAIVLKADGRTEEGFYVSLAISSYAPGLGDRFLLLDKLSEPGEKVLGVLYHYKAKKD